MLDRSPIKYSSRKISFISSCIRHDWHTIKYEELVNQHVIVLLRLMSFHSIFHNFFMLLEIFLILGNFETVEQTVA